MSHCYPQHKIPLKIKNTSIFTLYQEYWLCIFVASGGYRITHHYCTASVQPSDAALYLQICVYVEVDNDLNSKRNTEV